MVPLEDARAAAPPVLLGLDEDGPAVRGRRGRPAAGPVRAAAASPRAPAGERPAPPAPADGDRPVGLRDAVVVLSQADGGLVAYAAAVLNWHRRHRFCAACGALSEVAEAGLVRTCPRCRTEHHPRTDPVVIMVVTDGERLLLGRQAIWPPRRYSALAGFVEPGESLEEAVAREVLEESSVEIETPAYVASQPWPFPASLMLGFRARLAGGHAAAGGGRDRGRALVHARRGRGRRGRGRRPVERRAGARGRGGRAAAPAAARHRAAARRGLAGGAGRQGAGAGAAT